MGPEGTKAMTWLLESPQPKVRLHAVRALGRLGSAAAPQTDVLALRLAHDPDALVRRASAEALARCGELGVVALESCLNVPHPHVRERAAEALRRNGRDIEPIPRPEWQRTADGHPQTATA